MESLHKDIVVVVLHSCPLSSIGALLLTCSSFSYLSDKDRLLSLLLPRIPHRITSASAHLMRRAKVGSWLVVVSHMCCLCLFGRRERMRE